MEVYILDSLYRRTAVVDRFESLIWTERWADIGDFELLVQSTPVNRAIFQADVPVGLNESRRVMLVETVEDSTAEDGSTKIKVKGRSLEKILEDRTLVKFIAGIPVEKLTYTGTPKVVAETMANEVFGGLLNAADILPLLTNGTAYAAETIPGTTTSITYQPDPDTLLVLIREICRIYDMGFRLYRNRDAGQLYFNIYTGTNRTTQQTAVAPVVFSKNLETVQSTTKLMTIEAAKNIAYVYNEQGFQIVYGDDVDPTVTGFKRRILTVKPPKYAPEDPSGNPIVPTPTEISNYLIQQGKYELAKNRPFLGFDGEINQSSPYRYETHYFLGDIVEMRDDDGTGNLMRVAEQIFVSDGSGDRSYPTLVVEKFVVAGTWDSWIGNKNWSDFGATEYWNTQP